MSKPRQCPRCGNWEEQPPLAEQSRALAKRAERILNGQSGTPRADALAAYVKAQHAAADALEAASRAWDAYLHAQWPKHFADPVPHISGGERTNGKEDSEP
jgi:hypothetical protein